VLKAPTVGENGNPVFLISSGCPALFSCKISLAILFRPGVNLNHVLIDSRFYVQWGNSCSGAGFSEISINQ